ncbi:MAG: hypothetical protein AAB306_04095 [Pseudomonadota bacterium]
MEPELKSLEDKVLHLISLYHQTCIENNQLKKELEDINAVNKKLNEKIQTAASRLETLLINIPNHDD